MRISKLKLTEIIKTMFLGKKCPKCRNGRLHTKITTDKESRPGGMRYGCFYTIEIPITKKAKSCNKCDNKTIEESKGNPTTYVT